MERDDRLFVLHEGHRVVLMSLLGVLRYYRRPQA